MDSLLPSLIGFLLALVLCNAGFSFGAALQNLSEKELAASAPGRCSGRKSARGGLCAVSSCSRCYSVFWSEAFAFCRSPHCSRRRLFGTVCPRRVLSRRCRFTGLRPYSLRLSAQCCRSGSPSEIRKKQREERSGQCTSSWQFSLSRSGLCKIWSTSC